MGSFSKMTAFSPGYFRSVSRWLLNERRDVASRVVVLGAEMARIGYARILYKRRVDGEGNLRATYKRVGFEVTEGSTLARLVQAYIANGGNPWDISSFMYPDVGEVVEEDDGTLRTINQYPNGGVVAPGMDTDYGPTNVTQPGSTGYEADPGGFIGSPEDGLDPRYYPSRLGGRIEPAAFDSETNVKAMHQIRSWANQAVKTKLQDIEWRIIKQADLREQLEHERDSILVQAFGGVLQGLPDAIDDERFDIGLMVQNVIQALYEQLFEMEDNPAKGVRAYKGNVDTGFTQQFPTTDVSEVRDSMGV
jgi:hypothetical protein